MRSNGASIEEASNDIPAGAPNRSRELWLLATAWASCGNGEADPDGVMKSHLRIRTQGMSFSGGDVQFQLPRDRSANPRHPATPADSAPSLRSMWRPTRPLRWPGDASKKFHDPTRGIMWLQLARGKGDTRMKMQTMFFGLLIAMIVAAFGG